METRLSKEGFKNPISTVFVFLLLCAITPSFPNSIDSIQFGNPRSEQSHRLKSDSSEINEGALGLSVRKLLPKGAENWRGGRITFRMAVDPNRPNYFTAKFWGSEVTSEYSRLMLFVEGKQIGQRHLGEVDPLDILDDHPRYKDRFLYKTLPLPQQMTLGKDSVELAVEVQGPIWGYGRTIEQYQRNVTLPSRGIYRGYTHTNPFLEPSPSETQGKTIVDFPVRTEPGIEVIEPIKQHVNREVDKAMRRKDDLGGSGIQFLAKSCLVPWSKAYHNKEVLDKIVRCIDYHYLEFEKDPSTVEKEWHGAGPAGDAVRVLAKALRSYLDKKIDGTNLSRRKAWTKLFSASRDWHVQHRRSYTNQTMIVDLNIYLCNRAVRVLMPSKAWGEAKALRLLHEAVGIIPWSGSWDRRGNPTWSKGKRYMQLTEKGLTKELGYVGGYGEIVVNLTQAMYDASRPTIKSEGDEKLKEQLVKITQARAIFRYPHTDNDGFRSMRLESVIGWRDWHYPGPVLYGQMPSNDGGPFDVAAATLDPVLIGYGQQMIEDNQFFSAWQELNKRGGFEILSCLSRMPSNYELILKQPKQYTRLPMAPGQPDFVFADPEVGVVALKQGDNILYTSLYWRARYGINNLARVHYLTPSIERDATANISIRYSKSDMYYTMPDQTAEPFNRRHEKYYQEAGMRLATAGQKIPIARIPGYIKDFKPGKENIHAGKGDFYQMSYGPYYIAMNCNKIKSYNFSVPEEFKGSKDLIASKKISKTKLTVRPRDTIVLYRGP